jgi:NADH-quinone oxidoreductase subunit N
MLNDFFILMKFELLISFIIFVLLIIKLGKGMKNERLLSLIQVLLLANFIGGFFFNEAGSLFGGIFNTNQLMNFQKSILNLGAYLISLLFADWLLKSEHMAEFFILMLSAILGMFLLISSGTLLMFFLSLELSTLPVGSNGQLRSEQKNIIGSSHEDGPDGCLFHPGILLFGISMIYGTTGTTSFLEIPSILNGSQLQVFAFIFLLPPSLSNYRSCLFIYGQPTCTKARRSPLAHFCRSFQKAR